MTSNIGSRHFAEGQGDDERVRQQVMDDLRAHFRPEFLNRVDEVVLFHGLTREDIKKIVDIQLARVEKRLADQNITLNVADAAKELIAREGYDPVFGARPLKRVIQKKILDALSLEILSGRFKDGDKIKAVVDKKQAGALLFERA
jgi:ATP-dependent Clp protease ATP-binding subunit ClpB